MKNEFIRDMIIEGVRNYDLIIQPVTLETHKEDWKQNLRRKKD